MYMSNMYGSKNENYKTIEVFSRKAKPVYSNRIKSLETTLELIRGDSEANRGYLTLKTTYKIYLFI